MSSITTERITEQQKEAAKRVSVADLAERYGADLHKASSKERAGPCPKCGGTDRFYCTAEYFACRHCHPKRGDSIEFLRWLLGASFREAVASLTGETLPAPASAARRQTPERKASRHDEEWRSPAWQSKAQVLVSRAQEALWTLPAGHEVLSYLEQRALEPATWLAYRLGYSPAWPLPGTKGQQKEPAVVIPWYVGGKLRAVKIRFLRWHEYVDAYGRQRLEKQTALAGKGCFSGVLYGGHAGLLGAAEGLRWLLFIEGEINAMSCWQAAHSSGLDVLSYGFESAQISPKAVEYAGQYRRVLVWADRGEQAQRLMATIPGAYGVKSPGERDANDLLQAGLLGGFLAAVREDAARDVGELEALLWALYDAADTQQGIDAGSAQIEQQLAQRLGKRASIFEAEPDRWLTERWRE